MASNNNGKDSKKAAPVIMDPRLLMAARRGDYQLLENLLVNEDRCQNVSQTGSNVVIQIPEISSSTDATTGEEDGQLHKGTEAEQSESTSTAEISQHSHGAIAAPPLEGVTLDSEEDSALHIVAASGDSKQYLLCAELIYGKAADLLDATNRDGNTPLHSAARAGNLNMVTLLMEMTTRNNNDRRCGNSKKRALTESLRKTNTHGETALHGAVRSSNTNLIEKLISEDPGLVQIPSHGTSPLYLAFSLGYLDIATDCFIQESCKRLVSYSGPDGRNVLHVAVFQSRCTRYGWYLTNC